MDNGIQVETQAFPAHTVSVGAYINSGSAFENAEHNGVAHFLEHMCFKGTNSRTKHQLELEIESMGGSLDAYTSREQTAFFSRVFKSDVSKAVSILSDVLQNSVFDGKAIERERSTILREKEEVEMRKEEVIFDHLHSVAFQTSPLGRTILGTNENIGSINRDNLIDYMNHHITSDRMVIAATGAVEHDELVAAVAKSFTKVPKGEGKFLERRIVDSFTGSMVTVHDNHSDEVLTAVSFEGASWSDPDYLPLCLIQAIIGQYDQHLGTGKNNASRLCELIATENLATRLSTFNTSYNTTGIVGSLVSSNIHTIEDALAAVVGEYVRISTSVTEGEVKRAKSRIAASSFNFLDGTVSATDNLGRSILSFGRYVSPAELITRLNAITVTDVKRAAKKFFVDKSPAVAAVGNCQGFPDYNQIKGWTYWNRL